MIIFKVIVAAGLIILGSILVIDRQINIGQFVASEIIIVLIINAVEKLILSMDTFYDLLTALEKIGAVTDLPLESHEGKDLRDMECDGGIDMKYNNVSFTYPDGHLPVIHNFNLEVKSGERICLSGSDGSGKTTLFKLTTGLFDSFEGTITLNGLPIRSLKVDALRAIIGDNFNESDVFKGTLYENIQAGIKEVTYDDVMWASRLVGLDEFISTSPLGLETKIDPEGKRLASSITKKILMARCVAERPKILLIEDSITNLSPEERHTIYSRILDKKYGWTILIMSNDPAIAALCGKHYTITNGTINA
jgi:ABC-type bacteriocin/lantibiotic exporter with double-glycine peptidase domain